MSGMELGQAASKLLSALEQLGNSSGSGLHSSGSSAKPPEGLIKAFEDAMAKTDQNFEAKLANPQNPAQNTYASELAGPAREMPSMPKVEGISADAKRVEPHGKTPELHLSHQVNSTSYNQVVDHNMNDRSIKVGNKARIKNTAKVENSPTASEVKENTKVGTSTNESPKEVMRELNGLIEKLANPNGALTHAETFRLQYILGMLKMQSASGLKISQGSSQAIESVLKQNG